MNKGEATIAPSITYKGELGRYHSYFYIALIFTIMISILHYDIIPAYIYSNALFGIITKSTFWVLSTDASGIKKPANLKKMRVNILYIFSYDHIRLMPTSRAFSLSGISL